VNPIESLNTQLFLVAIGPSGSPLWLVECAKVPGDDLINLIPVLLLGLWLQGRSANDVIAASEKALCRLAQVVLGPKSMAAPKAGQACQC